ncbi:putative exported protein [Polaromonas sp. CG9_12]|nr:putative exported protein [Polaromonas sp. CG9_12]
MKKYLITSLMLGACALAMAKLPAVSPEAKAKSDEIAGKAAWAGKVDAYQLCQAQDRVAAIYMASAKTAGKETKPATATPPCADPGTYTYVPIEKPKPIEASGAHSPATTAASPPSSTVPDAVLNPAKKP